MNSLGRHILVEFYGGSAEILNDVLLIEASMLKAAQESGATIITSQFHRFPPIGVSGFIVLQESHFAIHTWPEYGYAALDLFTCGLAVNPWIAYDLLKKAFEAKHGSTLELNRGEVHLLETTDADFQVAKNGVTTQYQDLQEKRSAWFTNRHDNTALSIRHKGGWVFRETSAYQTVEVLDTFEYGNMLVLNNQVVCSEKGEAAYPEMMVHVPLLTHPAHNILVVGGGNGGSVREIFRHPQVEQVTLVERDEVVIRAAKAHLSTVSAALDHANLQLVIGDGMDSLAQTGDETYDLIVIDVPHSETSSALFSPAFYEQVYRVLKPGGMMVTPSQSPRSNLFEDRYRDLYNVFGVSHVHCYLAYVSSDPTGMCSFAYCSKDGPDPLLDFDADLAQQFAHDQALTYYNSGIHQAAFSLPTFVRDRLRAASATVVA